MKFKIVKNILVLIIFSSFIIIATSIFSVHDIEAYVKFENKYPKVIGKISLSLLNPKALPQDVAIESISTFIQPGMPQDDTIQPKITSIFPTNEATNLPLSSMVRAKFSEPVQPSTVTNSTFKLLGSTTTTVPGSVALIKEGPNANTAIFRPSSPLTGSKTYVAIVTTGVKDLAGNSMISPMKWSFTTASQAPTGTTVPPTKPVGDTKPPQVLSTFPIEGPNKSGIIFLVTATFDEPLQASTINTKSFYVEYPSALASTPTSILKGKVSLDPDGKTIRFVPTEPVKGTVFAATITTGIKDLAGNAMKSPAKWSFTLIP